ncbi:MAG: porin [Hyphomicrobiales bacterium]|nr:porin [Hyphomicrobiales bacterium]
MDIKKALVATSAICGVATLAVGSADAASKPKLGISGYYEVFAGWAAGDRTGSTVDGTPVYQGDSSQTEGKFNIVHYGEIRFKASGKTDGGMKWGVYFEDVQDDFDADCAGDGSCGTGAEKQSTDEANIWFSGSWGKVEIGGQDGPADRLYRGAEKLAHMNPALLDLFADTQSIEGGRGFAREKMGINDTSDATKITYYTPRISGFQAGYSWVPEIDSKGSVAGSDAGDDSDSAHEFGIDYRGKVGPGRLRATWSGSVQPGDTADDTGQLDDSSFAWRAGVTYSQGPWSIAAGYKDNGNERRYDQTGDETGWDVGVAYNGGRWEVALIHIQLEAEDNDGDLDWDHTMLTGAYNFEGGLTGLVSLHLFDLDDPLDTENGGNDGTAIIVGINAKF